jgi:hypothetical protein
VSLFHKAQTSQGTRNGPKLENFQGSPLLLEPKGDKLVRSNREVKHLSLRARDDGEIFVLLQEEIS